MKTKTELTSMDKQNLEILNRDINLNEKVVQASLTLS